MGKYLKKITKQDLKDLLFFPVILFGGIGGIICLLLVMVLIQFSVDKLYAFNNKLPEVIKKKVAETPEFKFPDNRRFLCPDEYTDFEVQSADFGIWTDEFYTLNPEATILDFGKARQQFYIDNNCIEALKRMSDYKNGNIEPEKIEMIKNAIQKNI